MYIYRNTWESYCLGQMGHVPVGRYAWRVYSFRSSKTAADNVDVFEKVCLLCSICLSDSVYDIIFMLSATGLFLFDSLDNKGHMHIHFSYGPSVVKACIVFIPAEDCLCTDLFLTCVLKTSSEVIAGFIPKTK